MEDDVFTDEQKNVIKLLIAQIWTGREGKVVEDLSKEINQKMFPLSEELTRKVDKVVEQFVYGRGVQEELKWPERLEWGLEYVTKVFLENL